jgi:hypothetical protein
MPDVLNGYEPAARSAERRALFDLRRQLAEMRALIEALDARITTLEAGP